MYKHNEPFVTPKYPITVPTDLYYSTPCVYRLNLGKAGKFYIGKAQSLPQTMAQIAVQVERAIRTHNNDETGWFYHIIAYIIKNRVMSATVERMHDEMKEASWELLKMEQELLDKNKNNPNCLNNNFDVYIPKWVTPDQLSLFNEWKNETRKANSNKHRATNPRPKHKGGQLAVRSDGRVPGGIRPKGSTKKGTGRKKASTGKKP